MIKITRIDFVGFSPRVIKAREVYKCFIYWAWFKIYVYKNFRDWLWYMGMKIKR